MEGRRFAAVLILTLCMLAPGAVASRRKARPSVCNEPADKGPCKGSERKFFFDITSRQCKMFTYGGCEGNGNNFNRTYDCLKMCVYSAG
uniref:Conotoxin superfamily conkunitzin 3 n=1 Tax=Conus magus TaxID=6492 RepID=A0A679P8Y7_CONMA|nr:TPA_inf: conotoxin superfamily conkunitzin 3 [Conus magus]